MKRKSALPNLDEEESKLSTLLFKKSKHFVEQLKNEESDDHSLKRKPMWVDEDDEDTHTQSGHIKVKRTQKFETLMGAPKWAKLDRKIETDGDEDNQILRRVCHLLKKQTIGLPSKNLAFKVCPQINGQTKNEGPVISCVEFHPKVSVSLVAGQSGVISLFSVGGDVNDKLHSFKLKSWNVSSCHFTPDGSEVYIASKFNHSYCVYDVVKAEPKLVQLPRVVKKPVIFELSPDGNYLATSDGFNEVFLVSTVSKELLRSLKHNINVQSVVFSSNSDKLFCYNIEGHVTIWDLSTFRVVKKFYDHGCITASCITTSPCGRLLATGSGEGIVNVYETSNLSTSEPIPLKTISNLRTKITNLKFNATSEILGMVSTVYPNAVKLAHIPSYHVFSNFPQNSTNFQHVHGLNFSPNSGFMALTNNKGFAYLYRLRYFKNY